MGRFRKVAETQDLEPGTARRVEIECKEIALLNVDGSSTPSTTRMPTWAFRWPRGQSRAMSSRVLGTARPTRQRP